MRGMFLSAVCALHFSAAAGYAQNDPVRVEMLRFDGLHDQQRVETPELAFSGLYAAYDARTGALRFSGRFPARAVQVDALRFRGVFTQDCSTLTPDALANGDLSGFWEHFWGRAVLLHDTQAGEIVIVRHELNEALPGAGVEFQQAAEQLAPGQIIFRGRVENGVLNGRYLWQPPAGLAAQCRGGFLRPTPASGLTLQGERLSGEAMHPVWDPVTCVPADFDPGNPAHVQPSDIAFICDSLDRDQAERLVAEYGVDPSVDAGFPVERTTDRTPRGSHETPASIEPKPLAPAPTIELETYDGGLTGADGEESDKDEEEEDG